MIGKLSRGILGVDIRSDAVSAVLVKNNAKGVVIEDTAHVPFGNGEDGLSDALMELTSQIDISGARCVVALPFSRLSIRSSRIPFKETRKIRQILPYELEPALALPVENQIIDYISLDQDDDENATDLLIAIVEQDELKFFLDRLKTAGIDPEVVTMNGHATAMALAGMGSTDHFVFADIGLKKVIVYMGWAGQIRFTRSFPVPSDPSKRAASILTGMRHTLLAGQEQVTDLPSPDHLLISGRGAEDPEVFRLLKENLPIRVEPLDFLRETKISLAQEPGPFWEPLRMDNPFALCYSEIQGFKGYNFRKGPFANKKFWVDHKTDFIRTGALAALVLLMLMIGGFSDSMLQKRRIAAIDKEIATVFKSTFPGKTVIQAPLEQMKAELRVKKKPGLSEEPHSKIPVVDMLDEFSRSIPGDMDIKFTKMVYSAGSVLISGTTSTFNLVDDMKNRLEKSEIFSLVTITSANQNRTGDRVEFKLKIDLI